VQLLNVGVNSQDLPKLATAAPIPVSFTLRIPKRAKSVRVVMASETGNRIGTAEVNRKAIDAAPAEPTPLPQLSGPRSSPPPQSNH
jgi:hypothetical protein